MEFHNIRLEAICHQTEDEGRVLDALAFISGIDLGRRKDAAVQRSENEGSFGNKIIVLSLELNRQPEIKNVFERIAEGLDEKDRESLLRYLPDRVMGTQFLLRLDKQAAYNKIIKLGSKDSIQIRGRVAAFPAKQEIALSVVRAMWARLLKVPTASA